jgi:molybdopterin-guanine dinucleotide biosynthesis protein A
MQGGRNLFSNLSYLFFAVGAARANVPGRGAGGAVMLEIEGFILTGGASRRMGRDKALLPLGGETFVARVARSLACVTRRVHLVSARPVGVELALPTVADIYGDCGALGGLHAALAHARAEWAAVVSCDLPFVSGALWQRLAALAREAEADAVVPFQPDGRAQPLCALYRRAACLEPAAEMLRAGERRPRLLLERVRARRVAWQELADLTNAELFFMNVNTPDDYEQARRKAGG